jgi:glutathione S-transferase
VNQAEPTFVLYGDPLSGNAYKTALILALTQTPYECRVVRLVEGENLSPEFLALNPLGKVPVLVHGDLVLRQSADTLRYVAECTEQFGAEDWTEEARIGDWIGFSVDYISSGVARLRFLRRTGQDDPKLMGYFQVSADRGLNIIETHLANNHWLACNRPTIADIAVYPGATFLPEAGYEFGDFPNLRAWMDRFEVLPGFSTMGDLLQPSAS